jgi:hypothetical protein
MEIKIQSRDKGRYAENSVSPKTWKRCKKKLATANESRAAKKSLTVNNQGKYVSNFLFIKI